MRFFIPILSCCTVLGAFVHHVDNQVLFSAVTAFDGLANLYLRMAIRGESAVPYTILPFNSDTRTYSRATPRPGRESRRGHQEQHLPVNNEERLLPAT